MSSAQIHDGVCPKSMKFVEVVSGLPDVCIDAALQHLVKSTRWLELDHRTLERGCEHSTSKSVLTTA